MKRFTLSLVIMAMVFGSVSLDVYARDNGRSSGNSGRSSFSGKRQSFQTRSSQQFQNRSLNTRATKPTTGNFSNIRDHRVTSTKPQIVNPGLKPRTTIKPIDTGIGNGKPADGGFTKPQMKPFTGLRPRTENGAPKPRPNVKPLDPVIGNGKPELGDLRPGKGVLKPRPLNKPLDPGIGNGAPKPRPGKPMPGKPKPDKPNPEQGHNDGGHHGGHHGNGHHNHGHHHKPWFHARPNYCWWWFNYCTPLQNCRPADLSYCDYIYPTCDYITPGGLVVEDARWYLGMKGMMLPGKGVGVESVEPNSPAAAAGLAPGMVITKCNGVAITDNDVLARVIAESGGVLQVELLDKLDGQLMETTIEMIRLPAASF